MLETAIVMPLYMLILLALVYFGYATLSRQRQAAAGALASWMPGTQRADVLLGEFWPWSGTPAGTSFGDSSDAGAGDVTLHVEERVRDGDEYYGEEIPAQIDSGAHSLAPGGSEIFDGERVAVSLWVYALGEYYQDFEWDGQNLVPRMRPRFDQVSGYLNIEASSAGFIQASEESPPELNEWSLWITEAFDGLDGHWMERRSATLEADYRPPFLARTFAETGAAPSTLGQYVTGDYAEPEFQTAATMQFDLTGRGEGTRYAAGEGEAGTTSADLLAQAAAFIGGGDSLRDADEMDNTPLGGGTIQDHWLPE
jgi:hypothetical protein